MAALLTAVGVEGAEVGCPEIDGGRTFRRKVELVLVSVLSVRSSRSVVEEPQERPRVSLVWVLLSLPGAGVVADPDIT